MSPVALIVRREIVEKLRSRAFRILNVVLLLVVAAATILPAVLAGEEGPRVVRVVVVGEDAAAIAAVAAGQSEGFDAVLEVTTADDEAAATAQLEADAADVALIGADRLVGLARPRGSTVALMDTARRVATLDAALADAGVGQEDRQALLAPTPLAVEALEQVEDEGPSDAALALGVTAGGMLYGLLIFYGQQVAQGVVQEKQSRVIEVLLAAVRPTQLLGGKLLGLGLLGLGQVMALGVVAYGGMLATDRGAISPEVIPTLVASVVWFILGYGLYATMFATAAAAVAKVEDLQTAMIVPIMVLVASFFLAQVALAEPDTVLASVARYLPTAAPIYQPLTIALGEPSAPGMVLAALGVVATTAVMIPIAARVHAGAALQVRQRISVRDALRRART